MASSEGSNSGGGGSSSSGDSALFSKLGGAIFGASGSPQKVVTNIRGFFANRITGALPEAGQLIPNLSIPFRVDTESCHTIT